MFHWLVPPLIPCPPELSEADRTISARLAINRYRSRSPITAQQICAAFAWLKIPRVANDELVRVLPNAYILYRTIPIQRGIPVEDALRNVQEIVRAVINNPKEIKVLVMNSGTAAEATQSVKNWFEADDSAWEEIDVEPMVTCAPNHKVSMYKIVVDNCVTFAIINNISNATVLFKLAAAILYNMNLFQEATEDLANAWMTGDGNKIYETVDNYYKEFRAIRETKKRANAIEQLGKSMIVDKTDDYKRRINSIDNDIEGYYQEIARMNEQLNRLKAEYLLYTVTDTSAKTDELKMFINQCGDRITYMNFSNNVLYLVYHTKLMYFEESMLKTYMRSTRDNCVTTAPKWKQQLLKDIFIDSKYDLHIESGVALNVRDNNINYQNPASLKNCYDAALLGLPNPHHMFYNCWGDNKPNIIRALCDKDYITAISTVFAAMSGLNISDVAVFERFIREEVDRYGHARCLEDKETGEMITIEQYQRRYEDNAPDETNE